MTVRRRGQLWEKVYMAILPSARASQWRGIGRLVGRPSALALVG